MAERSNKKIFRPAFTPEERENQLISLAYDLAEKNLRDGTASSQITSQLLKFGSQRERLEQQKIQNENLLLSAKVDQLASAKKVEELYNKALSAMREYKGEDLEYYENE